MPDGTPALDRRAIELLWSIIETPKATISGMALDEYHGSIAPALKGCGLLKQNGYDLATVCLADHDDEPVHLSWSADHGSYGYFSPSAGWITVPDERLATYRIDFEHFFRRLLAAIDWPSRIGPLPLLPDLLWEIGDVRLGRRTQRVPMWFARRLHDLNVWQQIKDMAKARPSPRLRILMTSTAPRLLPEDGIPGHLIVGLHDVVDGLEGLKIHPGILTARIDGSCQPDVQEALYLSPDGTRLIINGMVSLNFKSDIQITIIRRLVAGHRDGTRFGAQTLLSEAGSSVSSLARVFGKKKWAQLAPYLNSCNGLWGFSL